MKFVMQLAAGFLRSVAASARKLLSLGRLDSGDLCVFCSTAFLAAGYFHPWCLIVAFVCLLPPLQQQLYLPEEGAGEGGRAMTLEEELQSKILHEEKELAREMTTSSISGSGSGVETAAEGESEGGDTTPEAVKSRKKKEKRVKKEKKPVAEKPRVGKAQWGLPTLRVRDSEGRIIEINSEKPVAVETEYFKGTILMMLRTDGDLEEYNRYEHHFNGKQRKFEVQFQGNMKNVPQGEVMLGGELQEKMDISFVTRALLSVITKFCMSLNPFLHFGFGESPRDDGMFELPHLTFPLFRVMDRVIVTPPGGELPELGQELKEDEQQRKDRRAGRGEAMSFKQGYTYSFSFHSMYTDFSRWAICNFPGYKAIDIRGFFGQQHINVVCYEISEKDLMATGKAQHYNAYKRYLLTLELKHVLCMSAEELAEAEQEEDTEEVVAGSDSDDSGSDDNDDDSEEVTTTDCEHQHSDGDDMDEESLVIAREMADDHRDVDDSDPSELTVEMLHIPDESELISGDSVVSLIAIPAPWEPWDQELSLEPELVDTNSKDFDLDIDPRDGLSALRPPMNRNEGSRIMHGNAITHEDAGLSPKRTCFGVADVGGVAIRKECSSLPAVRFIPVTPPHVSTSRLARLSLRRNNNSPKAAAPEPAPTRRRSMLSALYPRRRNKSHAEKHGTITPDTTAATDEIPSHKGLRCGDAVQIQSATTNRFLTVHKGWWLGWSMDEYIPTSSSKHNRIASKVLFTIHPTDSTGLKYMPHGTPLVAGMPFRLRSVRWPDWEVGCCEPGRQEGDRQSPVVLYYAKIKVRNLVPISGPVKWHNSSKKVNPLCLSVMHEENIGGIDGRRRSMSSGSSDMLVVSPPLTVGSTGFESRSGPHSGPKRIFGVSPTRIVQMNSDITGISSAKEDESSVSTGSILTQFLAPLEAGTTLDLDTHDLVVTVSGWVEVLNRSLNYSQLAYIITVSYKSNDESSKATKWTTLRTQEDLEEIFSQIETCQAQQEIEGDEEDRRVISNSDRGSVDSNSDGDAGYVSSDTKARIGGGMVSADKDQWSVVDRDDEDRIGSGSERLSIRRGSDVDDEKNGSDLATTTSTRLQRAKRGVLRRSRVNIQRHDIAPNHLYPADQNVLIMTNRIARALSIDSSGLDSPTKSPYDSSENLTSYEVDESKSKDRIRHSSRDDGSGTQEHSKTNETGGEEDDQTTALKGYLSDSSLPQSTTTSSPLPDNKSVWSPSTHLAKKAFLSALAAPQILDTWFLSEDGDKYLRAPPPSKKAPPRQQVAIVARALWDSHWREEIAVVYPSYIAFYPLLAKKASWTLYLQELIGISHVADSISPLPGFSILRIETIGRLHYLAFASKESCNIMAASVLEHFSEITFDCSMPLVGDVGDPRDRFVLKSGRWRPAGRRLILNARKFLFDIEEKPSSTAASGGGNSSLTTVEVSSKLDFSENGPEPYWKFAERLLHDVFCLELNSSSDADGLFPGRELIIKFLDETVKLKQINLQKDINFSSPEALCFFTNIYHTLLMHARLVLGSPNQQDWASFFDTVCYEIGSEVFSLCEIEHCVLGGRLARPRSMPRSFATVPRANDDHYLYALPTADRRMRFLVNYGSLSQLPTIYLMTPETMHQSLNEASIAFFESSMVVDTKKRTVTLPKICDVFGLDFGEDPLAVLRHILRYLNRDNWEKVSILLTNSKAPTVKFQDLKPRSHTRLHLVIQK